MMRTKLKSGEIITLYTDDTSKQFKIIKVIGSGATCIAYEAYYIDKYSSSLKCRIKECYPYDTTIVRNGQILNWEHDDEKTSAFKKLINDHKLLINLKNNESIGNTFTASNIYEGNGTLYSVMELNHGRTYDQDKKNSLLDILETIHILSETIAALHDQGYLHLDIKPENFLVNHHPNTNLWLFDIDSLTSISALTSGKIRTVPYSQKWAAPEQLQGQINKICPATDIFAIGTILFEKIMGRTISNSDIGLFAEWEFPKELFEHVNPKLKRILKNIFRKTLAASVSRRYQNAHELANALKTAYRIAAEGKPFLKSDYPISTTCFVGRQSEIKAIHKAFKNNKRAVFLHGFAGMGKTELAKKYIKQHKNDYDVILFLTYSESLKKDLKKIKIYNYDIHDKSNADEQLLKLRDLLDDNCLLVIDNFDIEIGQDDYLSELLKYNARILFTSRTDFSETYNGEVEQIEVNSLPNKELKQIFIQNCGNIVELDNDSLILNKLLVAIDSHTYATELIAKLVKASGHTVHEVYNEFKNRKTFSKYHEKVLTNKDDSLKKNSYYEIIRTLFNITNLSEVQMQVLMNLHILRFLKLDKATYREITMAKSDDIDALNTLIELGYLHYEHNDISYLTYHPLISEIIVNDLQPDIDKCFNLKQYCSSIIKMITLKKAPFQEFEFSNIERDKVLLNFNWFGNLINSLDLTVIANTTYVIDNLFDIFNGDIDVCEILQKTITWGYWGDEFLNFDWYDIKQFTKQVLQQNEKYDADTLFKASNIIEIIDIYDTNVYNGSAIHPYYMISSQIENRTNALLSALENYSRVSSEFKAQAFSMLCKPLLQTLEYQCFSDPNKWELLEHVRQYAEFEHTAKEIFYSDEEYVESWGEDYIEEIITEYCHEPLEMRKSLGVDTIILDESNQISDLDHWEYFCKSPIYNPTRNDVFQIYDLDFKKYEYYIDYYQKESAENTNKAIIYDSTLTYNEKLEMYHYILDDIYCKINSGQYVHGNPYYVEFIKTIDWKKIIQMIEFQEEFYYSNIELLENEIEYKEPDIDPDTIYCAIDNYKVIAYAMSEDRLNDFKIAMKQILDVYIIMVMSDTRPPIYPHSPTLISFDDIYDLTRFYGGFWYILKSLYNLGKSYLCIPYIITAAEAIHDKLKEKDEYSETMMYSLYKLIIEFCSESEYSPEISYYSEEYHYIKNVKNDYLQKIDKIREKNSKYNFK